MKESYLCGKNKKKEGIVPAVALINPKYAVNVAKIQRSCSCFGVKQLWWTGNRVSLDVGKGRRLPREERMKGYKNVELRQHDYIFDEFPSDVVPVAVEVRDNSEMLPNFEHPEKALYVFGPEDGGLNSVTLRHCHRFVIIPSKHCLNLAVAASIILYDRLMKRCQAGLENAYDYSPGMVEDRGLLNDDDQNEVMQLFR